MQPQTMEMDATTLLEKYGKFLNLMKMAYICQWEHGDLKNARDDIDEMMDNLSKSDDISFVSLANVPVKEYFEDVPVQMSTTNTCTVSTSKSLQGR